MAIDVTEILTRKVGFAPVYVYVIGASAGGYALYKYMKSRSAAGSATGATGTTADGQGNQFTSSTDTQTTDASGNTVDTSFSSSGNGFLPGQLTTQASPMPFSSGDVYVNVPASTNDITVNTPTPAGPAAPASVPYVVTGNSDTTLNSLIAKFYRTPKADTTEYSILANAILAVNPGASRATWGSSIPKGTQINLPANYSHGVTTTLSNGQKTTATGTKAVL
jgi:phage tail protein X